MTDSRSFFLDLCRFVAASAVLLHHAFGPGYLAPHVFIDGRKAVIVFFVISGFVIAYVAETSERTWKSYLTARASRIYSVTIPALLLRHRVIIT
jgi:peptidoglycan/LPS O-acetylase OafA/YrhL